MGVISFELVHKAEDSIIPGQTFNTLLNVYDHIRKTINVPKDWIVNQHDSNEMSFDCCNAQYLIENYTKETLPQLISDIPIF